MRFAVLNFIPRGSFVLAATTLASYVLGLVRDRVLARSFGAGVNLDSYNAAFLVPDFLFNVLVASGIAAAAVPLFTQLYRRSHKEAYVYMNSLLASAVGAMIIVGVVIAIFAPYFGFLVAPGFDAAGRELVVQMMRILAISSILFAASNALGAMLVSQKRFLAYGLSPVVYNLGIITGALLFAPHVGVIGVAYGTVLGAALHFTVRCMGGIRSGWRWQWVSRPWSTPEMKRTFSLMLPKMIGHPVELTTFWVFTSLASLLAPGSITIVNFARNFQSVPVSLLGISMATAVFPLLAEAILAGRQEMAALLRRMSYVILGASVLAALVVYAIRHPLVAILLGGGSFDANAVTTTALVLGIFCLSIPTESLSHLFARAFYAAQNTLTPVIWSIVGLCVSSASAYALLGTFGVVALPIGFFLGSLTKTVGLWVFCMRYVSRR